MDWVKVAAIGLDVRRQWTNTVLKNLKVHNILRNMARKVLWVMYAYHIHVKQMEIERNTKIIKIKIRVLDKKIKK